MTATVESEIIAALNTHLNTLAGAWPRAFPNVNFTPPTNGKYLRVSFQPNETQTYATNGGPYIHLGLYQVTAVTKTGIGEIEAINQASLVARHFEYLTDLTTPSGKVRITKRPSVRPAIVGANTCEVPVTILYQLITD